MPRKRHALASKPVELAAQPKQNTEVRILLNDPEKGTSGLKEWGGYISEAYNAKLFYPGVSAEYARLRTSCPEMVMIGRAFTAWARNVEPIVNLPEEPTDDDKRYQDFILSDFENMEGGFGQYLETVVSRAPFDGFSWQTVVPALRKRDWVPPAFVDKDGKQDPDEWRSEVDDGLIGIRRLAYRDSSTLQGWEMNSQKRMTGFIQHDFPNQTITLPLLPRDGNAGSLHHQFGDPSNPEGNSPLQAVWRLERIKYGLEVINGIGFEHAAGYVNAQKTEQGDLSATDLANIKLAAKAILTAQEGNYAAWPFGVTGEVKDIPFQAAGALLEAIKHYSILMLSVYMMQFIALNTMTNTGAQASQVDSSNMGIFTFNSMLDGFAAQYDNQVGKRLYAWNRDSFPDLTGRPRVTFAHVKNNLAMQQLGSFLQTINGIVPLGDDDIRAFRKESGWMPKNSPEADDVISGPADPDAEPEPGIPDDLMTVEQKANLTHKALRSALTVYRRGEVVKL